LTEHVFIQFRQTEDYFCMRCGILRREVAIKGTRCDDQYTTNCSHDWLWTCSNGDGQCYECKRCGCFGESWGEDPPLAEKDESCHNLIMKEALE
jgi:hypothetical protein